MVQNKGLIFRKVPNGWPVEGQDLVIEDRPFDAASAEPPQDGIITKNNYVSFDPYQRGRMRDPEKESYSPPFELGKPITNSTVATIWKSSNPKFKPGDLVTGMLGTEQYSFLPAQIANTLVRKLDNPSNLDPKLFIGALGMPGLTAYSSLYEIGAPKKGETIFISSASGAVGQIVGQLAKHEGLTVIGSVGSDEKLNFIKNDLKFDEGFNYKKEKASRALRRLAPKGKRTTVIQRHSSLSRQCLGSFTAWERVLYCRTHADSAFFLGIDIYFESVGGEQLDAALIALNNFGRISRFSAVPCLGALCRY